MLYEFNDKIVFSSYYMAEYGKIFPINIFLIKKTREIMIKNKIWLTMEF
jgi:hypothetical protein